MHTRLSQHNERLDALRNRTLGASPSTATSSEKGEPASDARMQLIAETVQVIHMLLSEQNTLIGELEQL